MKNKIIIYGAGYIAKKTYLHICKKYEPLCFIEYSHQENNAQLYGLQVTTPEMALSKYPDNHILIAVPHFMKYDIINRLIESGVSVEKIIGANNPVEKRWGCVYLEQYVGFWKSEMRHCCSLANTYHLPFKTKYTHTPQENVFNYISDNEKFISAIQEKKYRIKYCKECRLLKYGYWAKFDAFYKVNISIESFCNYKCIYCVSADGVYQGQELDDGGTMQQALQFLNYCRKIGKIDDFANVWIAPGEPSLHTKIDEIVDTVKDYRCTVATNASFYSEPIAELLKRGMSQIRTSIDAGTPDTYAKVRGIHPDIFSKVCVNLSKYSSISDDAVELQYLILPGINTKAIDVEGFCSLVGEIGAKRVLITRDRNKIGNIDEDSANAIALMMHKLKSSGVEARLFLDAILSFTDEELTRVNIAKKWLLNKS